MKTTFLKKLNITGYRLALLLLIVVAAILRLIHLDHQSLWLDEIYTMRMADPLNSLRDIYGLSHNTDPQSVLYFFLLKFTFHVFGYSSIVARGFSVFFGIVGILSIYKLGSELKSKNVGLFAAILLSVNYFHIFYSQEARVYSMYLAFVCLAFYLLIRHIKTPSLQNAALYGVGALLMVWCHLFSLFVLGSQIIIIIGSSFYMVSVSQRKFIQRSLLSGLIVFVGYLPIIPILLWLNGTTSTWIPPISNDAFYTLFLNFCGDSFLVSLIFITFILFFIFKVFSEKTEDVSTGKPSLVPVFALLTLWTFVSFMFPYIFSFTKIPMVYSRYMISCLPSIILMASVGIELIGNLALKRGILILILIISLLELFIVSNYYKKKTKSEFREATEFVFYQNPEQSPIYTSLSFQFTYYFRSYGNTAPLRSTPLDTILDGMRSGKATPGPFWWVDAHSKKFAISDSNRKFLEKNFDEILTYDGFDAGAKYFFPKKKSSPNSVLEINGYNWKNDNNQSNNPYLYIYNSDPIESGPFSVAAGDYKLVIKSQSLPLKPINNEQAHLTIKANGVVIASYFVSGKSLIYGDTISLRAQGQQPLVITLKFDNDISEGKNDRNVVIRNIEVISSN